MKDNSIDTGSAIGIAAVVLMMVCIAFAIKNAVDRTNGAAQQRNQIIAENPGCIFIEESSIAKQYYMVCQGQLQVVSLKPIRVPVPPAPPVLDHVNNTTSEAQ